MDNKQSLNNIKKIFYNMLNTEKALLQIARGSRMLEESYGLMNQTMNQMSQIIDRASKNGLTSDDLSELVTLSLQMRHVIELFKVRMQMLPRALVEQMYFYLNKIEENLGFISKVVNDFNRISNQSRPELEEKPLQVPVPNKSEVSISTEEYTPRHGQTGENPSQTLTSNEVPISQENYTPRHGQR